MVIELGGIWKSLGAKYKMFGEWFMNKLRGCDNFVTKHPRHQFNEHPNPQMTFTRCALLLGHMCLLLFLKAMLQLVGIINFLLRDLGVKVHVRRFFGAWDWDCIFFTPEIVWLWHISIWVENCKWAVEKCIRLSHNNKLHSHKSNINGISLRKLTPAGIPNKWYLLKGRRVWANKLVCFNI